MIKAKDAEPDQPVHANKHHRQEKIRFDAVRNPSASHAEKIIRQIREIDGENVNQQRYTMFTPGAHLFIVVWPDKISKIFSDA